MKVRDMMLIPATNFTELRANFGYFPLNRDDLARFYVDDTVARGSQVLRQLELSLAQIPDMYQQVAYFGHIGSGKSTMLFQLEKHLLQSYRVIRYSVQDNLDINNITLVDLIYSMYERIYNTFVSDYPEDKKLYQEIYNSWNATISKEKSEERSASIEASAGGKGGLGPLFASLTSIFCTGTSQRTRVYEEVSRNVPQYITLLNRLISAYTKPGDKPILLMIEDLEKARNEEKLRDIFVSQSAYFRDLKLNLLITAPIFLRYTADFNEIIQGNFTATVICPRIRVSEIDRSPFMQGVHIVRDIVNARIDRTCWNPFKEADLEYLIIQTGGILRNTFDVITKASIFGQIFGEVQISRKCIELALNDLKSNFAGSLREVYFDLLKRFYDDPRSILRDNNDNAIFLELIKSGALIECVDENNGRWIKVHPLVVSILEDRGVL